MLPHPDGSRHGDYVYGVVQEVDVATGRVLFEWRTDEHVGFVDSYHAAPDDPTVPWDYFHVNSIAVDPADGHLLISGRNMWAFYKVHRRTGEVIWTLGGKRSDFEIGRGAHFAFQHHVRPHPGGRITIFDNEAGPPKEAEQSRGLVLAVDERAFTAKFVRDFKHRPPVSRRRSAASRISATTAAWARSWAGATRAISPTTTRPERCCSTAAWRPAPSPTARSCRHGRASR